MAKEYESQTEVHLPVMQEILQGGKYLIDVDARRSIGGRKRLRLKAALQITAQTETKIVLEHVTAREEQIAVQHFGEAKTTAIRQAPPS